MCGVLLFYSFLNFSFLLLGGFCLLKLNNVWLLFNQQIRSSQYHQYCDHFYSSFTTSGLGLCESSRSWGGEEVGGPGVTIVGGVAEGGPDKNKQKNKHNHPSIKPTNK